MRYEKHNMRKSRIYSIWCGMKTRCYNKNREDFERYGARGITVCDEWLNSFKAFYTWSMLNGYTDDLHIDRINNNEGYTPRNCRFVTVTENNQNRRSTKLNWDKVRLIRRLGDTKKYTQQRIAERFNVNSRSINYILNNKTWKEQS